MYIKNNVSSNFVWKHIYNIKKNQLHAVSRILKEKQKEPRQSVFHIYLYKIFVAFLSLIRTTGAWL